MDPIVMDAFEIEFHSYNINRDGGFGHSKSWKPLIGSLKLSGHTRFRVHNVLTNNPALLFETNHGTLFCSPATYKPTPLRATPTPLCIHDRDP
jgi:hypothetical protein